MGKRLISLFLLTSVLLWAPALIFGLDKLKVSSGVKLNPVFYLPPLAAEEKGFWKENAIDGEYVPFESGRAEMAAVAAGHVVYGMYSGPGIIEAVSRGLPIIAVSDHARGVSFNIWVRGDRPWQEGKELRSGKIGISGFGATEHAYGRLALKALGIEKEVKFLATGGIPASLATLKTGAIDAVVLSSAPMIGLKLKGEAKVLVNIDDYLPREWAGFLQYARKDFVKDNSDLMKRGVKAMLQAIDFIKKNPAWATEKMKAWQGYTDEAARFIYKELRFTRDGKIDRQGLENVRNFLAEFGLVAREKLPPVAELYTDQFTP